MTALQRAGLFTDPGRLARPRPIPIGRLLAAHTPPRKREANFEIVNQLNRGAALITVTRGADRSRAEPSSRAGERGRLPLMLLRSPISSADSAYLAEDSWERRPNSHVCAGAEAGPNAKSLTGELAAAEERLTALSRRAANTVRTRDSPRVCA